MSIMRVIEPTLNQMRAEGNPFTGFLYAGLVLTDDGPKVLEFNVRLGDPETQAILPRLESDLVDVLEGAPPVWSGRAAVNVVMAAKGYPGDYEKGTEIRGLDAVRKLPGVEVFHAGTRRDGDRLLANGGRVLAVTARGKTVAEAQRRAYEAVSAIDWPGGFCRTDIGWRAIARERSGS